METKRKGARSSKDLSPLILDQLNKGELETVNLVEWLAVDQQILLQHLLHQCGREHYLEPVLQQLRLLPKKTVNTINQAIGAGLYRLATAHHDDELFSLMANHPSDLVRCWATYAIADNKTLRMQQVLEQIRPFAADGHFGVREIAWLSIRPVLAQNLEESINILSGWTADEDPNVRRFASEATRPRGVWCAHIEVLKTNPEMGLRILEPLKADDAKYVQDSVGNWLNDASKTRPDFVKTLCGGWEQAGASKATQYIIRKALRTIAAK
jgi:3-methyladenine DNA glycosylase AlkC